MRIKSAGKISKCELEASDLDLVSRAKTKLCEEFGNNLLSRYPDITSETKDETGVTVNLDVVLFSEASFHQSIRMLGDMLSEEDFKKVIVAFDLKEL